MARATGLRTPLSGLLANSRTAELAFNSLNFISATSSPKSVNLRSGCSYQLIQRSASTRSRCSA
jgi:hypothetical protein